MGPCGSGYVQLCRRNYALQVASNTLQVIQWISDPCCFGSQMLSSRRDEPAASVEWLLIETPLQS